MMIMGSLGGRFVVLFNIYPNKPLSPFLLVFIQSTLFPLTLGVFRFMWKASCVFHGLVNQCLFLIVGHPWSQDSSLPSRSDSRFSPCTVIFPSEKWDLSDSMKDMGLIFHWFSH